MLQLHGAWNVAVLLLTSFDFISGPLVCCQFGGEKEMMEFKLTQPTSFFPKLALQSIQLNPLAAWHAKATPQNADSSHGDGHVSLESDTVPATESQLRQVRDLDDPDQESLDGRTSKGCQESHKNTPSSAPVTPRAPTTKTDVDDSVHRFYRVAFAFCGLFFFEAGVLIYKCWFLQNKISRSTCSAWVILSIVWFLRSCSLLHAHLCRHAL